MMKYRSRETIIMVITLPGDLESAISSRAKERGIAPEVLALGVLRREFVPIPRPVPQDEWERTLFAAAIDCGVSVPHEALSSDGLYD
jgi:hypothetical protein